MCGLYDPLMGMMITMTTIVMARMLTQIVIVIATMMMSTDSITILIISSYVYRERSLFTQTGARLSTFYQSSFSKEEAAGFARKGFVFICPEQKLLCYVCAKRYNEHCYTDQMLGPLVRIRRYCVNEQESGEEVSELCVG